MQQEELEAGLSRPKCLIVTFAFGPSNQRFLRYVRSLEDVCDVTVVCYGVLPDVEGKSFSLDGLSRNQPQNLARMPFPVRLLRAALAATGFFSLVYWRINPPLRQTNQILDGQGFDFAVAYEIEALPIALKYCDSRRVILDLPDLPTGQFLPGTVLHFAFSRYRKWLSDSFLSRPRIVLAAGERLGIELKRQWRLSDVRVVRNIPDYYDLSPSQVGRDRIELVYHGLGGLGRGLEELVESLTHLGKDYSLTLMLSSNHGSRLLRLAKNLGVASQLSILDPVRVDAIPVEINKFDIAVVPHQPIVDNFRDSLPNKFFESIQARLALVTGPSIEMEAICAHYGCGKTLKRVDATELARSILSVSRDEIFQMKLNSDAAAKELYWDRERLMFLDAIRDSGVTLRS